ncbi:DUF2845 domain-containing protein [Oleiharenicola lentus]|uniref:DUF2845 domain-containing protein n=1 Tax=Oleiharenicola lentus TaxID=2508720 RepID=A0A4Q1C836_9BACT|nr:DUF2845 domain-containing protein [Oleiharenicola lentus]RXK55097.1 DUF2845 domain-containing protein [Oleiharenicola lentus]
MNSDAAIIWIVIGLIVGVIIIAMIMQAAAAAKAEEERRQRLYTRYGKTSLAEKLIARTIWTGETAAQLRDSLGHPLDVDQKVLKTKKKEVWKYKKTGTNRYALKITLDDDVVVGWDQK